MIRVAVDAMGSDRGAEAVDRGRARSARRRNRARHLRLGRTSTRAGSSSSRRRRSSAWTRSPRTRSARRTTARSSRAVKAVADGEADAVVSAGNTGAMLAAGLVLLRRIPGVRRPAIAVPIPARKGPSVLIDAGANADCRAEHLLQFATMGAVFAEEILGVARPERPPALDRRGAGEGEPAHARGARAARAPPISTSAATPRGATSSRAPPTSSSPTASRATSR